LTCTLTAGENSALYLLSQDVWLRFVAPTAALFTLSLHDALPIYDFDNTTDVTVNVTVNDPNAPVVVVTAPADPDYEAGVLNVEIDAQGTRLKSSDEENEYTVMWWMNRGANAALFAINQDGELSFI